MELQVESYKESGKENNVKIKPNIRLCQQQKHSHYSSYSSKYKSRKIISWYILSFKEYWTLSLSLHEGT